MTQITGMGEEEGVFHFRAPKTEDKECVLLERTVPKNTQHSTKWCLNVFGKGAEQIKRPNNCQVVQRFEHSTQRDEWRKFESVFESGMQL